MHTETPCFLSQEDAFLISLPSVSITKTPQRVCWFVWFLIHAECRLLEQVQVKSVGNSYLECCMILKQNLFQGKKVPRSTYNVCYGRGRGMSVLYLPKTYTQILKLNSTQFSSWLFLYPFYMNCPYKSLHDHLSPKWTILFLIFFLPFSLLQLSSGSFPLPSLRLGRINDSVCTGLFFPSLPSLDSLRILSFFFLWSFYFFFFSPPPTFYLQFLPLLISACHLKLLDFDLLNKYPFGCYLSCVLKLPLHLIRVVLFLYYSSFESYIWLFF
jgi:hypothetical protein